MTKRRPTTIRPPMPVVRAAVFAACGAVLGVSAHHLVAEDPVPWGKSVAAAAAFFVVGLVGARRERSLAVMVATCCAAQVALHLWLTTAHAHPAPVTSHHSVGAQAAWHERLHDSLTMSVLHAAAALAVAVLLHRADRACWSLARSLTAAVDAVRSWIAAVRQLTARRAGRVGSRPGGPVSAWLERPASTGSVLAHVVVRRGPPPAGHAHPN
ncbi:hypothetical protein ABZZ79_06640 [Streptomyces sp. NPDC006458]|uniref:hypothetical protein n=1 Tax=Streptomyces sp. NPDC006458 TaxID=3154302 RepID=UPI0033BDADB2